MIIQRALCALLVAAVTAGCGTNGIQPYKRGQLATSQARGILGSRIGEDQSGRIATAAGTLLAMFHGTEVGDSLERSDRHHAEEIAGASLETSPVGETSTWKNPANGHTGAFTPSHVYLTRDHLNCRDFEHRVTIGAKTRTTYGTACRTAENSWRVAQGELVPRALRREPSRRTKPRK